MATPTFRFAPSPNGALHLGHARSAIVGYDWAQRVGGRFLLRIEDIDRQRARPEYIDGIYRDLTWLGLSWEAPVVRQSEHFANYQRAAAQLTAMGVLYPCFATRTECLAAAMPGATDPDGAPLYPGLHRALSIADITRRQANGQPFAQRINMPLAQTLALAKLRGKPLTFTELDAAGSPTEIGASPERWGDAVIVRKDTPASYHLAVVVDDARQGVTHVTRGRDLFAATDLHRLLQVLLDLPEPLYHHHALMTDGHGRKLSKSAGDTSLRALRDKGYSTEMIRQLIGA